MEAQNFNVYLVRGRLYPEHLRESPYDAFRAMKRDYDTAYNLADHQRVRLDLTSGGEHDARVSFRDFPPSTRSVTEQEWYRVYAQMWMDSHGLAPRIGSAQNRVIMPFSDVLIDDYGYFTVRYGHLRHKIGGVWSGRKHDLWQSFATVPGNLTALDLVTDERGRETLDLSVLVYQAIADTPHEFALWLAGGVESIGSPAGRRAGNVWIKPLTPEP